MKLEKYHGECFCENISYSFYTSLLENNWRVRKCGCSFCTQYKKHVYCSDPSGYVNFYVKNIKLLNIHNHGTNTADFLVCNCGSYMGAVMKTERGIYSVINLEYMKENINISDPYNLKWQNELSEGRIDRRYKTWTPVKDYFI